MLSTYKKKDIQHIYEKATSDNLIIFFPFRFSDLINQLI